MGIDMGHFLELKLKTSLSPELQQSMRILQMGIEELNAFLKEEAMQNPVIDIESFGEAPNTGEQLSKKLEWLEDADKDNRVFYQSEGERTEGTDLAICENTLQEYLLPQLYYLPLTPVQKKLTRYIIDALNPDGYLEDSAEFIAQVFHVTMEEVQKALEIIQDLEPWGVGARDLKECIIIQLRKKQIYDQKLYELVEDYLELLSKNKLNSIARAMQVTVDELQGYVSVIKSLNPKPGSAFGKRSSVRYMIPDILVIKFKDYFEVLTNQTAYPHIVINPYYKTMLKEGTDADTCKYISKCIDKASWALRCIEQRNSTLLQVAKTVVEIQKDFFDRGTAHLLPMTLRDIAVKLNIHESTVSRAIRDKYLQCPWGVFSFKYFFSSGISGKEDEVLTPTQIMSKIKRIIKEENKAKPLSDQKISDILAAEDSQVARRTVAKYREALNIPAASERKTK